MKYLNYDNTVSTFMRITGIDGGDFCHAELLENAEQYIVSHLLVSAQQLTDEQKGLCEYAAAAVAAYDYTFELCLKERVVMSENGEVSVKRADNSVINAAAEMRKSALSALAAAKLTLPDGFAFVGI